MNKSKVLAYCDSPAMETGFAQVSKQILRSIYGTNNYDITVVGINHQKPNYDRNVYPYSIYADFNDMMSSNLFAQFLLNMDFDILFTLNDFGVLRKFLPLIQEARKRKNFVWITYSPVDTEYLQKDSLATFQEAEYPVSYTNFGYEVCIGLLPELKEKLKVIYHGTDTSLKVIEDKMLLEKMRRELYRADNDCFVVTNVNRNQWRKDFWRSMVAFREFKYSNPLEPKKAKLYLHAKSEDVGGSLAELSVIAQLKPLEDLVLANFGKDGQYFTREKLNLVFSSSDVGISTSVGEGWGLQTGEFFITKKPIIVPRNTSSIEIIGEQEERGYLALSGSTESEWAVSYGNSNYPRPLTNIPSMVEKLDKVYKDWKVSKSYKGTETGEKIENAYNWGLKNTWDIVNQDWIKLFELARIETMNKKSVQ